MSKPTINGIGSVMSVRLSNFCDSGCGCLMVDGPGATQGRCSLTQRDLEHYEEGFFAVCDGTDERCGNERAP